MSTEITGTGSVNLTPPAVALNFGSLAPHSSRTLGLVINPSEPGAGTKTWNAKIVYSNGAKGWLELDHTSGVFDVEVQMIHVTANATNMLSQQEGDEPLAAKIIFTSAANGTASASTEIPVSVYINEIPFHDGGPKCPPPPPPHLKRMAQGTVENSSTGPFVSNPASYNNGTVKWWIDPPKVSWLTAQPSSGTLKPGESAQVTWQVKAGLSTSANPYKTDIMLNVGYDSPQKTNIAQFSVSVMLTV